MSGILDLLGSDLGKTIISGVAGSTGNDTSKTGSVLTMALPVLMKAMERNASTPEGAQGLLGALNKHQGGILDNLGGLFGGGVDESVTNDGGKILGHILGSNQGNVEKVIGQKSGLDAGGVANILKTAAPILMGLLGKQTSQNNVSDQSGLMGVLGGLLGGASQAGAVTKEQTFLEKMLDSDGDGSVIDDVAGLVLGQATKGKGGLGGLLGGLFGK
ncbi:DUF937 domain-containing protein [uncultured Lacinutrix sp.]|uniref:DUF937 domain-containing protein n=1 Tax=uncultured Lacinutrix sp. TaxID=574032 RepID=UPI00262E6232|nr:DUF937 domain-containing protein [uncultured Lacinutrix sp.]